MRGLIFWVVIVAGILILGAQVSWWLGVTLMILAGFTYFKPDADDVTAIDTGVKDELPISYTSKSTENAVREGKSVADTIGFRHSVGNDSPIIKELLIGPGHAQRTLALRTGTVLPHGRSQLEFEILRTHPDKGNTFLIRLPEVNKSREFWAVLTDDKNSAKTFYFGSKNSDVDYWFSVVGERDRELKDDLTLTLSQLRQEYRDLARDVRIAQREINHKKVD